ncbi:Protein kinase domain-containing protein [Mycena venus]|uniref:Protein kinase domain-containing protein n=1 Tax=Mycena venus TaxID=2733690 RepID=A0A8H6XCW0_9AGAR|nr:Protein kinase domain-containing protein [Mycena venus]
MPVLFYPDAPLPPHLEYWEGLDLDNNTAHLVDEPWRYFEPFLASRGYTLCWKYYSREKPETPIRPRALKYPVAQDPFRPRSREGFVHLFDNTDQSANQTGIHQTTGWLTQCASLKMAYDAQDRVCALKALHNSRSRAEIDIITFLNSPKMRACADNHTIPLLDKVVTEEWTFIVMPYWPRSVQTCIPWEVEDYFNRLAQALEGLAFMHRHGIVHRDISIGNMLLNVHYGVPGVYSSFARRNIALAYIDLGCACRFPAGSDPATWVGTGYWGTMDHAAPEIPRGDSRHSQPYHLPPVDVYALGSVFTRALSWEQIYCKTFGNPDGLPTAAHQVLREFVPGYVALLERMKDPDPTRRPTAFMALQECNALRDTLDPSIRFAPPGGYPEICHLRQRSSQL